VTGPAVVDGRTPALTVRGLRKRYSRRGAWVLDGVDLDVEPGSVTLVHGGNGSGKSTLLRVAAGVTDPTAGTVVRPHHAVAYVPERVPAQIRMTTTQYLGHMGRIRGLDAERCTTRVSELAARLDVEPGPDVPITQLSKGNRQKVLLAQAFLAPVALLALDEPFAGLDREAHSALRELIDDERRRGAALLVTGHSEASFVGADRVLRIAGGWLHASEADVGSPGRGADARTPGSAMRVELTRGSVHAVVVVDSSASDELLARAIAGGWSVVRLGREERS
jgi:ABC-type multidrug transport system ATPase subunit